MSKINYYFAKDCYIYKCDEIMYRWYGRRFDISEKYNTEVEFLESLFPSFITLYTKGNFSDLMKFCEQHKNDEYFMEFFNLHKMQYIQDIIAATLTEEQGIH